MIPKSFELLLKKSTCKYNKIQRFRKVVHRITIIRQRRIPPNDLQLKELFSVVSFHNNIDKNSIVWYLMIKNIAL